MSPRPRLTDDVTILAAAARSIGRFGPRVTLADVADEAGTSSATLIQRFTSKHGLLLALAASTADAHQRDFEAASAAAPRSPVALPVALANRMSAFGSTPEEVANRLAVFEMHLADPAFRPYAVRSAEVLHETVRRLVADAVRADELQAPVDRLARLLTAMLYGSAIGWTITRRGTLQRWLRSDLEAMLAPYRSRR